MRTFLRTCAVLALVLAASQASAALVFVTDNQEGPGGASFTPSYIVSTTDLLDQAVATSSIGNFTLENSGGVGVLTNGAFGTIFAPGGGLHPAFATGGNNGGTSVTYSLGANSEGYNLTSIDVYGGWNDAGRDQQRYDIFYSTVDNPSTFIQLSGVNFNPSIGGGQSATRVTFFDDASEVMASNVAFLRFDFLAVENGYTGYAEIDAFGVAVPEPSTYALLGLAGAGFWCVRRRRRTAQSA